MVQERLRNDREIRLEYASPSRDIFQRTAAYLSALQKLGCHRPALESTHFLASEKDIRDARENYMFITQRGYKTSGSLCDGRLIFDYDSHKRPHVRYVNQHILPLAKSLNLCVAAANITRRR